MSQGADFRLDVLVFGGGIAGLWLVDELTRRGRSAICVESVACGAGQTVCAQGIIHGGLKYTLDGLFSSSAEKIREMPQVWRECLAGRRSPELAGVRVRADHCYLWRTDSLISRLGMLGARTGLRVAPVKLPRSDWPAALRDCPGDVFRLDELVLDPVSLLTELLHRNVGRVLKIESRGAMRVELDGPGRIACIEFVRQEHGEGGWDRLRLRPRNVVLAAGAGNDDLRQRLGLREKSMQLRPLHMLMLRGRLPTLNGHCTDGARTRVTITSDTTPDGRTVWQVGGQIAEDGVTMSPTEFVQHGQKEIRATIPGLDLSGIEWSSYTVDRAEAATEGGKRPNDASALCDHRVITAWPTKLALAPRLADEVISLLEDPAEASGADAAPRIPLEAWPRPVVASPPWEEERTWISAV